MHACTFLCLLLLNTVVSQEVFTETNPIPAKRVIYYMATVLISFVKNARKKKTQSKVSDSFSLTVLEHEYISLPCKSGYGSVSEAWRQK